MSIIVYSDQLPHQGGEHLITDYIQNILYRSSKREDIK